MVEETRIFVVHVIHHLMIGGIENGVVNLINQLPSDRFKHAVICVEDFSDFRERIKLEDVEVFALHRSKTGAMSLRWQLYLLFRRLRPDIVHSRNLSGLDALLPAWLAGIAAIHSEHGFDVDNLNGKNLKSLFLRRLHTPLVRHYLTVSRHLRAVYVEQLGVAPSRITQIYNGVDTQHFTPARQRTLLILPEGMRDSQLFIVGSVGRLRPIKDHATLIYAMAILLEKNAHLRQRVRLIVVGDGPLLETLKALAERLGIAELVWFSGARHDVADLLKTMHLFVLTSLNEGVSNTLLEAMATGIPVLATAVGGNIEVIDEGVVGYTFFPGDAPLLAELIARYIENPDLSALHGAAARSHIKLNFSLTAMVNAYQDMYQKI